MKGEFHVDYVINNGKGVYIQLDQNGRPITCSENNKGLFEYNKARNICGSLPKTLKKMGFKVEVIPDIPIRKNKEPCVIKNNTYIPKDSVTQWIEKFGECGDILQEAQQRKDELNQKLSDVDKELCDLMHSIEFAEKFDMYEAWKALNKIKEIREKRRNIKDEQLIIQNAFSNGITYLSRKSVKKAVDGLSKRKYKIRIIEEDDEDAVM